MLKVKNIKAGYKEKIIVDDINFSVEPGEFTGILGLNGSGKTTLLKTISGLLKPLDGEVLLDDENLLLLNEKELARHISFMPQSPSIIYDIRVIDLVLMGITPYLSIFESPNSGHMEKAYEVLEKMNIEKHMDRNFLHLSEGEKQLVIMARSLMQDAEIMLFDEPVSALDFKNKHFVLDNIRSILNKENKIGIISLHDPNLALRYCDKIIIIDEGEIYAEFSTGDIDVDFLTDIFSNLYGEISVVEYGGNYLIVS